MTKRGFGRSVVLLGLLCAAAPVLAHHSFSVEYDANKPMAFEGVVTKIEWTNPHARVYVDVPDGKGGSVNWNLELASPSALARNGWTSRTLKVGDKVTVEGYAAKVAPNRGNARSVITADGRSLFGGAADDNAPGGGNQ